MRDDKITVFQFSPVLKWVGFSRLQDQSGTPHLKTLDPVIMISILSAVAAVFSIRIQNHV